VGTDGGGTRRRDGSYELGDLAEQWANVGANSLFALHPDTEPAAIRAAHRRSVAVARRLWPRATPEEIGRALCLPTWNVERAMKELGAQP
jgi:hypothetical protein